MNAMNARKQTEGKRAGAALLALLVLAMCDPRLHTHTNDTVGTVAYLGGSVFHHATPINADGKRLVFCMFYASADGSDLSRHAFV